ncbi:hypothetical protein DAEQUDRAFT_771018 [Daedalea quercina L-15889]|uniref:Uncharacterized protein n=1 Tax=Daedalea quercina L-15889 TaxID=1314783 RepID=A0A165KEI0_9APHY|nr:hypothetical protein DAEQUDRAFT_771018 [Daedalea quercina L-15889]
MSGFTEPTDNPDYLEKSDDLAATGDESEQTNKPEPIAEASALESESNSDSDSNDEMMTIGKMLNLKNPPSTMTGWDKKRKENLKRRQPSGPAYIRGLFKDLPIEDRATLFKQLSEDF